jgi:hypothetical protein
MDEWIAELGASRSINPAIPPSNNPPKKYQPLAAIGSSPDSVTSGGKNFFMRSVVHHYVLPTARGDRFLSDGVTGGGKKISQSW